MLPVFWSYRIVSYKQDMYHIYLVNFIRNHDKLITSCLIVNRNLTCTLDAVGSFSLLGSVLTLICSNCCLEQVIHSYGTFLLTFCYCLCFPFCIINLFAFQIFTCSALTIISSGCYFRLLFIICLRRKMWSFMKR